MSDKKKTVIALGYFDSVHLGHRKVIEKARQYAMEHDASLAVFTFGGNLKAAILGEDEKNVYTPCERRFILKNIGVDEMFFAPVNKTFLSLGKLAFLNMLNKKYDIIAYVSGFDYTFGKKGVGGVKYLGEYAKAHNQEQIVVDTFTDSGEKVSTTLIKKLLENGKIERANILLGDKYFVTGIVTRGRKVGSGLGFPTVNLKIDKSKFQLKNAVYKGYTFIDGKKYTAIINYGARPTFNLKEKLIEAHLLDYSGTLYGREIALYFTDYMRDIIKFNSKEQLTRQLKIDQKNARGEKDD